MPPAPSAIVFDFDGVLVESVDVKLDAYAELFEPEGAHVSARVREYCQSRMGLSRFQLIDAIYRDVLTRELSAETRDSLLARFSALVVDRVFRAPLVPGTLEFLSAHADQYRFFIVSAAPEAELRDIVRRRELAHWFEATYGAPTSKEVLLERLMSSALRSDSVVFVGDSDHDWNAAKAVGIPFIWRRRSDQQPTPDGFAGPAIDTLADLASCLERMSEKRRHPAV